MPIVTCDICKQDVELGLFAEHTCFDNSAQLKPFKPSEEVEERSTPVMPANDITDTLKERGARYGKFTAHAHTTMELKRVMQSSAKWNELDDDQKEALDMIAHKVGRILNGDPNYHDSWHDIVGYAKLVADRLEKGEEV